MAKSFQKGKAAAPAAPKVAAKAAPAEEVESAIEAGAPDTPAEEAAGEAPKKGGSNAPRARKWNYGPIGPKSQAKILKVKDAACPKGVAAYADTVKGGMTVEQFYGAEVPDTRHVLRVMLRGKFIVIKDGDAQYPVAYDHAAAAAAREAKAAAKAAASEEAEEVTA